jgi:hypothetical protein
MTGRNKERGTVLIIAAIMLPVLLAGLGLVIDNGQAYDMKRRLQSAADAGAMAAAHQLRRGDKTKFQTAALDDIKENGFTSSDTQISILNPPKTGKRAGDKDFVEIVLRHEAPLFFMKPFYNSQFMVEARSIGGLRYTESCVIALNKTASAALLVSGTADVDISVCAAQVNSNASNAARSNGGGVIKAARFEVVGNYTGSGFQPTPLTGMDNVTDPLASLAAPSMSKCNGKKTAGTIVKNNTTLNPGTYCGGITVQSGGVATLNKGIYVLGGGGLVVQGGGTIKGDEVVFYNTGSPYAPIEFSGGAIGQLSAPKDGTYKGILFFGDRTITDNKSNIITANSDSYFTGALYFPSTKLTFIGTSDVKSQKLLMIADTIEFQGNTKVTAMTPSDGVSPYAVEASLVY